MRYRLLLPLAAFCASLTATADITPAALFTDNAVLQRDKPAPVWGKADPGEHVRVSFAGQTLETTADAKGQWRVTLAPLPARSEGSELLLQGNNTIRLTNVVVGEVWIASGQSNMEWTTGRTFDQAIDVPASARLPMIRHIKIRKTVATEPAAAVAVDRDTWEVAGPGTTGNFTAVGYYFAKDIQALTGVPVGIIGSNWGGTRIEAWIDPASLAANPAFANVGERWSKTLADYPQAKARHDAAVAAWEKERDDAKAAGQPFTKRRPGAPWGPGHPATPSGLYNGMISPLVPYAIRGAIWYQGESNAGRASEYHALQSAMITGWRAQFGQGNFPFYWVQLANYSNPEATSWAFLREAQTQTLSLPNTGQAVIIDIGNRRDIHPRNKKDVGRRLARIALHNDYGFDQIAPSGPTADKIERTAKGFRITFTNVDQGLIAPLNELVGFELAGEDRIFKPAEAVIDGASVNVTSAEVAQPVAVRYAWRNAPLAGLFNQAGLPAVPFRSDDWPQTE